MIFDLRTFTLIHVAIGLAAIAAGFVVLYGLLTARRLPRWTAFFLAMTAATSVTGFLFPFERFLPSHATGIVSLLVFPAAVFARYGRHLAGRWRLTYVITTVLLLHLNVFVLIVQAFQKVPGLTALAPTQSEPPFALAQGAVFLFFVGATIAAALRFRESQVDVAPNSDVTSKALPDRLYSPVQNS